MCHTQIPELGMEQRGNRTIAYTICYGNAEYEVQKKERWFVIFFLQLPDV